MIVSQTPLRVSFAGGGTDLHAFYRGSCGAVLSVTMKQHLYVTLHRRFESTLRIRHARVETVEHVDAIEHGIVRECLRHCEVAAPLDITTISDVPAGSGLGSSSALAVGLLNAVAAHTGRAFSPSGLAERACHVEISVLKSPIGKQDQYAAAFGGLNCIRFNADETVNVEPVPCSAAAIEQLEAHVLIVYAEERLDGRALLERQRCGVERKRTTLDAMRGLVDEMRSVLVAGHPPEEFGKLLHEGWLLKRSLDSKISNSSIDARYDAARAAGAWGGKILGAGGGGFMLFYAPPERHRAILSALGTPPKLDFAVEPTGSRIAFKGA